MPDPTFDTRLVTRTDLQDAVRTWCDALEPRFSAGRARVLLGHTSAHFDDAAIQLEGFARPLWALAPLAAGGGTFGGWDRYREGLINGTDPGHPEYWGALAGTDQRMVEMAAIGFSLAVAADEVWKPLDDKQRERLADWLLGINDHAVHPNNWLFFRVLVNLGLARVGARHDPDQMHRDLDQLESFDVGNGWYTDGVTQRCDWYIPWAMHFYGLLYAGLAGADDPARATRFRERAATYAPEIAHWFAADGSALPYGRSLTYRFAQSAFWGALAYADVEVDGLSWGAVRGLALRNVRWWTARPIFAPGGTLTLGYGYPNHLMLEAYNSPGSPYWALKAAIPLAVPDTHPFWTSDEEPLPELDPVRPMPQARMVVYRDPASTHVIGLANGQPAEFRHSAEKYDKFAYSTAFGFSVPAGGRRLTAAAADSMLAVSDDGSHYRVREEPITSSVEGAVAYSRWSPFDDVEIETWLTPAAPWHVRVHRIRTGRRLSTAEGGFATSRADSRLDAAGTVVSDGTATVRGEAGASGIVDLAGARTGVAISTEPTTNLMLPRAVIPTLTADLEPGEHWLTCAVLADPDHDAFQSAWDAGPPALGDLDGLPLIPGPSLE